MELKSKIHYVGVNDRRTQLFEGMWPLPCGVSYNSYLIEDERCALIDTVELSAFPVFLKKIRQLLGSRPVDYLVVNHMEPDHSGSIALLRRQYPQMQIVGNKKTIEMIGGFYHECEGMLCVGDGDELSLGSRTLRFCLTPMVHWPETMMTLLPGEGVLFSGDAFGCFGTLDGAVVDRQMETERYFSEMVRYYAAIVGKYGAPVQKALARLSGVELTMLCPAHGPVWQEQLSRVVSEYNRMSLYQTEPGAVVAYGSMYGNTAEMAEAVAEGLSQGGVRKIVVHNVSTTDPSYILADIFRYRALVVGSPVYNGTLYPGVESLLRDVAARSVQHHLFASFGSFAWASVLGREMAAWAERLKFDTVQPPVENKQGVTADSLEACRCLGRAVAARLACGAK